MLVSTLMHVLVLGGLAFILVSRDAKPEPFVIEAGGPVAEKVEEFLPVEVDLTAEPADQPEEQPAAFADLTIDELLPEIEAPALVADLAAADVIAADASVVTPISFDAGDVLADLGGGGEQPARSGGRPATAPGAPTFFGRAGQGASVCFVCDNSSSYRDGGFHTVLAELATAVDALRPGQSFFVIFFSDAAYPMGHPEPLDALQPATPETKRRLRDWLETVEMCVGGQGIHDAVELVSRLEPEVVYLLSDGDHGEQVVEGVVAADLGETVVHTFGIQQRLTDRRSGAIDPAKARGQEERNETLIRMAQAHGGTFTPVVVPPQAAALEKMRPIRRNPRGMAGPVWGMGN